MRVKLCACGWPMLQVPEWTPYMWYCSRSSMANGCGVDWLVWRQRHNADLAHYKSRGYGADRAPQRKVIYMRKLLGRYRKTRNIANENS